MLHMLPTSNLAAKKGNFTKQQFPCGTLERIPCHKYFKRETFSCEHF